MQQDDPESCCLVTQWGPTLPDPMGCSTPGLLPSPSPGVCPSSCSLHQWCHPAISNSDALFYFCPQFFPASGSFPMSWLFTWCNQTIGASASASVLPMSIQGWFPLRLTGWISLQFKGLSRVFSSTTVWHQFHGPLPSFTIQFSQPCMTTGKTIALIHRPLLARR